MTPLRVVLAIESSGPGGAENVVLRLAAALRRRGDEPIVATLRPGWMTQRAEEAGIPVWIAPQRPGLDLAWIGAFARRMRRERIDVLHTHEFAMNVFGGVAALLRAGAGGLDDPRSPLDRRAAAARVGLPDPASARHPDRRGLGGPRGLPRAGLRPLARGARRRPQRHPAAAAIPDGERAGRRAAARRALGVPDGGALCVAVGNLYPVKDHATLLRAQAELPDARVAIAGRGDEEAPLRRLAGELGLADRLHLLGLRDDVDTVLAAGDVFVQPSRSEGLPLAVLEAMAAGLPVVATRVGGVAEAVAEGETGYLVPSGDPPALAAALRKVLAAPDRGAALGARGRQRAGARVLGGRDGRAVSRSLQSARASAAARRRTAAGRRRAAPRSGSADPTAQRARAARRRAPRARRRRRDPSRARWRGRGRRGASASARPPRSAALGAPARRARAPRAGAGSRGPHPARAGASPRAGRSARSATRCGRRS